MADEEGAPEVSTPQEGETIPNFGPLPDFVVRWGHSVQRPRNLPEDYDKRINPADIFVFPRDPTTGADKWFYVVPKGCTKCQRLRQRCNRGSPCDRCARSGTPCIKLSNGWDELPLTKIIKKTSKSAASRPKTPSLSAPHASEPASRNAGGRTLRQQNVRPSYVEPQHLSSPPQVTRFAPKKRPSLDGAFVSAKKPKALVRDKAVGRPKRTASAPVLNLAPKARKVRKIYKVQKAPKAPSSRGMASNFPRAFVTLILVEVETTGDLRLSQWKVISPCPPSSSLGDNLLSPVIGKPWAWSAVRFYSNISVCRRAHYRLGEGRPLTSDPGAVGRH